MKNERCIPSIGVTFTPVSNARTFAGVNLSAVHLTSPVAPDMQGSFYANPLMDDPAKGDTLLMQQHPAYFHPNIWPSVDLPALESAFKTLGQLVVSVGLLLSYHFDK